MKLVRWAARKVGIGLGALGIGSLLLGAFKDVAKEYLPQFLRELLPSVTEMACFANQAFITQPPTDRFSISLARLDNDTGGTNTARLVEQLRSEPSYELRVGCRAYSSKTEAVAAAIKAHRRDAKIFIWGWHSKANDSVNLMLIDSLAGFRPGIAAMMKQPIVPESDNVENFSVYSLASTEDIGELRRRIRATLRKESLYLAQFDPGTYRGSLQAPTAEKYLRRVEPLLNEAVARVDSSEVVADLKFAYGSIVAHTQAAHAPAYDKAIGYLEAASQTYSTDNDLTAYVTALTALGEALRRKALATNTPEPLRRAVDVLERATTIDRSRAPRASRYAAFMQLGEANRQLAATVVRGQAGILNKAKLAYEAARIEMETEPGSAKWTLADLELRNIEHQLGWLEDGVSFLKADLPNQRAALAGAKDALLRGMARARLGVTLVHVGRKDRDSKLLTEGIGYLRQAIRSDLAKDRSRNLVAITVVDALVLQSELLNETAQVVEAGQLARDLLQQDLLKQDVGLWAWTIERLPRVWIDKKDCFPPEFANRALYFGSATRAGWRAADPLTYAIHGGSLAVALDQYGRCAGDQTRLAEAAHLYRDALQIMRTVPVPATEPGLKAGIEDERRRYRVGLEALHKLGIESPK